MGPFRALERLAESFPGDRPRTYPDLCSDLRDRNNSCQSCVEVCPESAVTAGRSLEVGDACTGCGICTSACPNGALLPGEVSDDDLAASILNASKRTGTPRTTVSCSRGSPEAGVVVSCLSRLTETILIRAVVGGVGVLRLEGGLCDGCRFSGSMSHFETVLLGTRALLKLTGLGETILEVVEGSSPRQEPHELRGEAPAWKRSSRRELISRARSAVAETVQRILPGGRDEEGARGRVNRRREGLLAAISAAKAAGSTPAASGEEARSAILLPRASLAGEISIDEERCNGCGVCGALCPLGALGVEETERRFRLLFSPARCTVCGLCQRVCEREALQVDPAGDLSLLFSVEPVPGVALEKTPCPGCGAFLVLTPGSLCVSCEKRGRLGSLRGEG